MLPLLLEVAILTHNGCLFQSRQGGKERFTIWVWEMLEMSHWTGALWKGEKWKHQNLKHRPLKSVLLFHSLHGRKMWICHKANICQGVLAYLVSLRGDCMTDSHQYVKYHFACCAPEADCLEGNWVDHQKLKTVHKLTFTAYSMNTNTSSFTGLHLYMKNKQN